MRQPRRKFAQRRELLTLLLDLGVRPHAIGQHANQPLRKIGQVLQQVAEISVRVGQSPYRERRSSRQPVIFQPRKWQKPRDRRSLHRYYGSVATLFFPPANLAFEQYKHQFRGSAFLHHQFARLKSKLMRPVDEPVQVSIVHIGKYGDFADRRKHQTRDPMDAPAPSACRTVRLYRPECRSFAFHSHEHAPRTNFAH